MHLCFDIPAALRHTSATSRWRCVRNVIEAGNSLVMLTGTPPGEPGVGGVILDSMVDVLGSAMGGCAWAASRNSNGFRTRHRLKFTRLDKRFETGFRPVSGFPGELISAGALRILRPSMLDKCAKGVTRLMESVGAARVIAVLESPAAIQVAALLQRKYRVPVVTVVWDDVQLLCHQAFFDRWTANWLRRDFAYLLQHSERVGVICENMQRAYKQRYGVDSVVVRHGLAESPNTTDRVGGEGDRNKFLIGFAGSITAPDAMAALMQVLDNVDWHIGGRQVVVRMLGVRYLLDSRKPQHIEFLGWRSNEETRRLLSECNLLFLPQTFSEDLRFFSELSFPTKLSTYVAARQPIMLHAPQYASLADIWRQSELGPYCDSLAQEPLLEAIRRAVRADSTQRERWLREVQTVHRTVLSAARFAESVRELVGIPGNCEPCLSLQPSFE